MSVTNNTSGLESLGRVCFFACIALLCGCQPMGTQPVPRGDDQEIKLVDGIDRFERKIFASQVSLGVPRWLDNQRILAVAASDSNFNNGQHSLPLDTWMVIDTGTGAVAPLPWRTTKEELTEVVCYHARSGRIFVRQRIERGKDRWDARWMVGTFGPDLPTTHYIEDSSNNGNWPKSWSGLQLTRDCRMVAWPEQLPQKGYPENLQHLEEGHGWLHAENLRPVNGVDGIYHYIAADGKRTRIPITGGERNIGASDYHPYANAYLLLPVLHFGSPHHVWTPHYARLLHLDGRIERFPVPEPFMRRITRQQGSGDAVSAQLTRRGLLWRLTVGDRDPNLQKLKGNYLQMGNTLLRVGQRVGTVSPDGCKLLGETELSRYQLLTPGAAGPSDYFTIDLCKEMQP